MAVLEALGHVMGAGGAGALGAYQALDFGKKGAALGALIGIGGYGLGQAAQSDDGSLGDAMLAGAITGSVTSAFSTFQEVYAFQHPNHVSNLTSINTTTSATAQANAWYNGIRKMSPLTFMADGIDPANWMTDVTRMAMISSDMEGMASTMKTNMSGIGDAMDSDASGAKKAWETTKGFGKAGFGMISQNVKDSLAAAEASGVDGGDVKNKWFTQSPATVDVQLLDKNGRLKKDSKGNVIIKGVDLTGKESMSERMGMFIDAQHEFYDATFQNMNALRDGDIKGILKMAAGEGGSNMESEMFKKLRESQKNLADPEYYVKNRQELLHSSQSQLDNLPDELKPHMESEIEFLKNATDDELRAKAGESSKVLGGFDIDDIEKQWNTLDNTEGGAEMKDNIRKQFLKHTTGIDLDDLDSELNDLDKQLEKSGKKSLKDTIKGGFNKIGDSEDTWFKNSKEYSDYIRNIDGGALGTYKEMKRAGLYDGNIAKKGLGYLYEGLNGSPAWARTVDHQMKNGTITNTEEYTDHNGKKQLRMVADADGKIRFKGKGKAGRIGALLLDTVGVGGLTGAAASAGAWALSRPFSDKKNDQSIQSNNAYNPI